MRGQQHLCIAAASYDENCTAILIRNSRLQICLENDDVLRRSGLDNAGKTTIVKRINGEDISTVSPTLGFNIKTMEYNGCVAVIWLSGQSDLN